VSNEFARYSTEADAPFSVEESHVTPATSTTTYMLGVEGTPRPVGYGENSWLSAIIVAMLVVISLNMSHCRQLFKNFSQNLIGLRCRANAFDNRTTNELRTLVIIIMLLCLSEGILLFAAAVTGGAVCDYAGVLPMTMSLAAISLGYYLWQLAAYKVIGYAFADRDATRQWLSGFNASQTLLSLLLIAPALVAMFYDGLTQIMLIIAAGCYMLTRVLFIYKGFRIFYTNLGSLLYFILYLCALEITPLLILRRLSLSVLRYLEFTA